MAEDSRSRIGQQIGNYHLTHLLGQGGFADVYLGQHIFLKTQAAIKLLRLYLTNDYMEGFLNEAQTIAKLKHPHIVGVFECGIDQGTPFLVMDYIPDGSLRQRYPKGSRLLPEQIAPYVQQVASALQYAHQQKLIHRDIKPENMLLGKNGEVLLSDFGLVLIAHSSGSQTTREMAGTIPYMAPEQLRGRPRIASDQYALGIVVYEWLSGERPFTGTFVEIASQHMIVPPPSLCEKVPTLSPAIEQVVFKSLEKDPTQRFESVQAFADALTNVIRFSPVTFMPSLKDARQLDTPLSDASTLVRVNPVEGGNRSAQSSSDSSTFLLASQPVSYSTQPTGLPVTLSDGLVYNPAGRNSSAGNYPSQPAMKGWENSPAPEKRRGRLWAVVCLLFALLLIAGSASYLLTHSGIFAAGGSEQGSSLSRSGEITTTPSQTTPGSQTTTSKSPQTTPTTQSTIPVIAQTTPTVQATTPVITVTTPTVQATTPVITPNYTVVDHMAQAALSVGVSTTVSAQCASGEQMLSGGYYMSDGVNPAADSYPSASDTWTVTAMSGYANTTLYVYVTCLQANFSAHMQVFRFASSANTPNTFACPAGSALTGGGFQGYAAIAEPRGNGWLGKPGSGNGENTNYVLCATANLIPATPQVSTFSVPPQTNSGLKTLSCPAGSQLTGGGFSYDYTDADVYVNVPRGISPIDGWSVGVYNHDPSNAQTASAWAICVQVPATVH